MRRSSSFSVYMIITLVPIFVDSKARINHNTSLGYFKKQAPMLYRELGLSYGLEANIVKHDPLVVASKIVEKRLRFPSLSCDYEASDSAAGPSVQEFGRHYAGYYSLKNTHGPARMFYYFFESRKNDTNAPVIVWLTGGPGCSGSLALFYENGPFHLTNNLSLVWNEYGWDKESNILYIDQPTGTGFSYTTKEDDLRNTSEEVAIDLYNFLQHLKCIQNEFQITGESYAGHYIPAFAAQIQKENQNNQGIHINLQGMAIGNGWTNSGLQTKSYPQYAKMMNLINQSHYEYLQKPVRTCQQEVHNACDGSNYNWTACAQTNDDCNVIFYDIMDSNDDLNFYDIRKKCEGNLCYNFSGVERFLNQTSVKGALGVSEDIPFVSCSSKVGQAMSGDQMRNLAVYIPELLQDGIKLLIYAGEYDLICNWLGNLMWVADMKWSGRKSFRGARSVPFKVDGVKHGWYKTSGPLTFLMVKDAGHMVPMDQPKASLEMLRKWTKGIHL